MADGIFISGVEVAEILCIHPSTFSRNQKSYPFMPVQVTARRKKWRKADVLAYVNAQNERTKGETTHAK